MSLNLTDRAALKSMIRAERLDFAKSKSIQTPQKLDNLVASLAASLAKYEVSLEEGEFKERFRAALDAAAGAKFVNASAVLKDMGTWIAPMKPALEPETAEGEGEEAAEG